MTCKISRSKVSAANALTYKYLMIDKLFNVIDYANKKDLSGALLSVDLYKAFDSLRWPFIFALLRRYGFRNLLIKRIKVLYKNRKCKIIINNFLSPFFQV